MEMKNSLRNLFLLVYTSKAAGIEKDRMTEKDLEIIRQWWQEVQQELDEQDFTSQVSWKPQHTHFRMRSLIAKKDYAYWSVSPSVG